MSDKQLRELERRWRATGTQAARDAYLAALRRVRPEQLYLVYRTPYEDPSCKRIVKLKGETVLEWFQEGFRATRRKKLPDDPEQVEAAIDEHAWGYEERITRGGVYGLSSIFRAVLEHDLPVPETWEQLQAVLDEHLYLEGPGPKIEDGVMVALTDDDEIDLAYYLFPQSAVDLAPERLSWLLHKSWRLPKDAATHGAFEPPLELPEVEPAGDGEGATFLVDMTIREGPYLGELEANRAVQVLPGVRVPDLPDYLRAAHVDDDWPTVLFGLRVALGPKERSLRNALQRCEEHDTEWLAGIAEETTTYAEAREALGQKWADRPAERAAWHHGDPLPSRRQCTEHLLQLCRWDDWKYDRWIVFDDLWAAAHPDLASSLLWYGFHEDPFR